MTMCCKGVCAKYIIKIVVKALRYSNGLKRCQVCEVYIKWEGVYCPCCGGRLRTKARSNKCRQKHNLLSEGL